jgi:hypothetical protein
MSDIQAISLDLWGTVICSNPAFKIAAANSISRHCVSTPDEITTAIRQLKDQHNVRVEAEGHASEGSRSLVNENTVLERGSDDSMTLFVAFL